MNDSIPINSNIVRTPELQHLAQQVARLWGLSVRFEPIAGNHLIPPDFPRARFVAFTLSSGSKFQSGQLEWIKWDRVTSLEQKLSSLLPRR
ncbi:hypothetical protein Hsar01_02594 [Haloferula sargassicola]|uniref:Uncharacterized protein n=1 Tax=Haloferula sargassicola TaxID=490096 RepID=A0ABP9UU38_9BACT